MWFMDLPEPNIEQSGLISILVGVKGLLGLDYMLIVQSKSMTQTHKRNGS